MTKKIKTIDKLYQSLKDAGIKVKRDGWIETIPKKDSCEWLDIKIKGKKRDGKKRKKYVIHLYFTENSTTLHAVEVWGGKGPNEKLIAGSKNAFL